MNNEKNSPCACHQPRAEQQATQSPSRAPSSACPCGPGCVCAPCQCGTSCGCAATARSAR